MARIVRHNKEIFTHYSDWAINYALTRIGEKPEITFMNTTSEQKFEIIQHALNLGMEYEKAITGCCQCTIAAIQDALKIRNDAVFKAGNGLTAGGGLSCEGSCGGYTGGVMVMSSIFGRRRERW